MIYRDVSFLNKDYKFVTGDITADSTGVITDICEKSEAERGILPPFVDIHIHGGCGVDIMNASVQEICALSDCLYNYGVGAYMPTTVAKDYDSILSAAANIKKAAEEGKGAKIIGIHTEGPFISKDYKGIMEEKYIRSCDTKLFDSLREVMGDLKIRFTIAPEAENAVDFCRYVTDNGGYVSMGHSGADAECCRDIVKAGASSYTHIFNAMAPLHHRKSSILSSALTDDNYAELICDFVHISKDCVKIAAKAKEDKIILITDAMEAMGKGRGKYIFCGSEISVDENSARDSSGRLAGSILTMAKAVENMAEITGLKKAVKYACENPAKLMNLSEYGYIDVGKKVIL